MDTQSILLYVFGVVSTLYVLHLGFYLTGANLYDIWQARRRRDLSRRRVGYEPLVTVAIPAHNEEKVIGRCLDSIRNSSYARVQVLVADDASTDHTYRILMSYKRRHPAFPLTVLRKRANVGKASALNAVLGKCAKGELVMALDADSALTAKTIENAVSYFVDPSIVGVAANVQILDEFTMLGVLQRFEHMIGYRSKKVYSMANCEFVVGGVASTYRTSVLREVGFYDTDTLTEDIGLSMKIVSRGNRHHRIVYAADVVAQTEGVDSFRALLRQRYRWKYGSLQNIVKYRHLIATTDRRFSLSLAFYRMPMAVVSEFVLLFSPLVWGYVIYMTLLHRNPQLFIGAYLTITLYTLITVWFDEHTSFMHRVHLTLYVPIAYFIYYVMDFIQLVAMSRCVRRYNSLLKQKETGSVWTSPRRIGRKVLQE